MKPELDVPVEPRNQILHMSSQISLNNSIVDEKLDPVGQSPRFGTRKSLVPQSETPKSPKIRKSNTITEREYEYLLESKKKTYIPGLNASKLELLSREKRKSSRRVSLKQQRKVSSRHLDSSKKNNFASPTNPDVACTAKDLIRDSVSRNQHGSAHDLRSKFRASVKEILENIDIDIDKLHTPDKEIIPIKNI